MANIVGPYLRILQRARESGEVGAFSDSELEVVVHILMGARGYLSQRLEAGEPVDPEVIGAYAKLLNGGLFGGTPAGST